MLRINTSIICTLFRRRDGGKTAPSRPSCCLTAAEAPLCFSDCCYMRNTEWNQAFRGPVCRSWGGWGGGAGWHSFCSLDSFKLQSITRGVKSSGSQLHPRIHSAGCHLCLPSLVAFTARRTDDATNQIMSPSPCGRASPSRRNINKTALSRRIVICWP